MSDDNTYELISKITELNDLHEFLEDDHIDRAMAVVLKLISRGEPPAGTVSRLIVELQALSTKFAWNAAYYATIGRDKAGTPNNHKKNIYYSTKEALDKLVDALKYLQKAGS